MKKARFFVTFVLILGTVVLGACTPRGERRQKQVTEGNKNIKAAEGVEQELAAKYAIQLARGEQARTFDWHNLTREQRQGAREKLAEYVRLMSRVLELEAQKGLYLTVKHKILDPLEAARAYQKSMETFEIANGENFEPKKS